MIRIVMAAVVCTCGLVATADDKDVAATRTATPAAKSVLGRIVGDFTLRDYRGKQHALSDYAKKKVIVLAVSGTECPLAKLYAPRLQQLSEEFSPRGVAFLGINANSQDSVTELAAFARVHRIAFPLLKDPGNVLADRIGAKRTPEVFVLDSERIIRYRGRIDDQYGVGFVRPKPTRRDLAEAIGEVLDGKPVSEPSTEVIGCLIGRVTKVKPHGNITYHKQITRLLQRHCVQCHRNGDIAPFPLTSYKEVVGWSEMMQEVMDEGRMPPWNANPKYGHFKNAARITDGEKEQFYTWVENGCPEGDAANAPEPLKFVGGWRIPKPDVVFTMRDKPYQVPAEGVVKYQYFVVNTHFKEDKWIQAAEARPGNRSVVHHILVFIRDPKSGRFRTSGIVAGFAPGTPPPIYSKGVARRIPADAELMFQLHYTPNGSPQEDLSSVGIVFADRKDVKREITGGMAANRFFSIPAQDGNYKVVSSHTFRRPQQLISLSPHMHLRGKSFRFVLEKPGGEREILLDVPRYDFNWQLRYELAKPRLIAAGSRLLCTAYFDNSQQNLSNPDPTQRVSWGDQTWQEMMIGWFTTTVPVRP